MVAGEGFEPHDLRVMSPTSYQLLHPAIYKLYAVYYKIYLGRLQHFCCWCRKPGLNRYATHVARDFKSRASANSAIPAERPSSEQAYYITPRRLCQPLFSNLPLNVHRKAVLPIRRAYQILRGVCQGMSGAPANMPSYITAHTIFVSCLFCAQRHTSFAGGISDRTVGDARPPRNTGVPAIIFSFRRHSSAVPSRR